MMEELGSSFVFMGLLMLIVEFSGELSDTSTLSESMVLTVTSPTELKPLNSDEAEVKCCELLKSADGVELLLAGVEVSSKCICWQKLASGLESMLLPKSLVGER
jgi:hypothetical protein